MKTLDLIESLKEIISENHKYLNHTDLVELLQESLEALEEEVKWRITVDDELVSAHMVATDNPRESIHKLIDWHTSVQIDPRVSGAALALYQEGFADGEAHCKERAINITEHRVMDLLTLLKLEL